MSAKEIYIVSTPIGNLSDISQRALALLEECDCIIAEDTRSTKDLLKLLSLPLEGKSFFSFHEHNQAEAENILKKCQDFKKKVLVSDAGSPVLSDPGFPFLQEGIKQGYKLTSIPGPSSITTALEVSGLAPIPFSFTGFLPRKEHGRKQFFSQCQAGVTYIGLESPQRIVHLVDQMVSYFSDNIEIVIARELTKKFEQVLRFKGSQWSEIKSDLVEKGEIVILWRLDGANESINRFNNEGLVSLADDYLSRPTPKKLSRLLGEIKGVSAQDIYNSLKN